MHEVPEQQLREFLIGSLHPLIGFVGSFVLIGTYWLQHYAIFHFIKLVDRVFVALNGLFLLCVSFVPFPTGLQAAYRDDELAFVIYGGAQLACSLALLALWIYATRNHRLVAKDVSPQIRIRKHEFLRRDRCPTRYGKNHTISVTLRGNEDALT